MKIQDIFKLIGRNLFEQGILSKTPFDVAHISFMIR